MPAATTEPFRFRRVARRRFPLRTVLAAAVATGAGTVPLVYLAFNTLFALLDQDRQVDCFVSAIGTGGTLAGGALALRERTLDIAAVGGAYAEVLEDAAARHRRRR